MSHRETSPFHRGEQSIQARVGVREKVEQIGRRFIRDHMPDEHRAFYEQLPFLLFGSVDEGGRPWASILAGPPGFVRTPDERTLDIAAVPFPGDPAGERLEPGAAVGLLGIEFENRRRNRVNGRVSRRDAGSVTIAVDQSFGNCPMYLQARTGSIEQRAGEPAPPEHLTSIDESVGALIAGADSFFIATHFAGDDDGRVVVDGIPALRSAFFQFENFKLETVAQELLGRGKIIGVSDEEKVAEIGRLFREEKPALAEYNLEDCRLVTEIFDRTDLVNLMITRVEISW